MSYKPEFEVQDKWYDNAQRFATHDEAEVSARARFSVWTMPSDWRVTESDDPVSYRHDENGSHLITVNSKTGG